MAQVTALAFQRNIGEMQERAQFEPVEVMKHGRKHSVLLGASLFDELVSRARRSYSADELPDDLLKAIESSKMSAVHAALDKLLEE